MSTNPDPFTIEILQSSFQALTEEMFVAFGRTATSPTIYESLDCGVAMLDPRGRLTSNGAGAPLFIGMLDGGVQSIIGKFGYENIRDGDVFISNGPYTAGHNHLNDVSIMVPVFCRETLVGWMADKGHWSDIGGAIAGSIDYRSTEIFQEGLQFPDLKLFDRGALNNAVVDMIAANTRLPETSLGDMWAGIAAARVGQRRLAELAEKYGVDAVAVAIDKFLEYGEMVSRRAIAQLPKGVFEAQDRFDEREPVRVKVTITDDEVVVDLRENKAVGKGSLNCPYEGTAAAVKIIFKALTSPGTPVNEGTFRPLKVLCHPGSRFAAERPTAVGMYFETMMQALDLTWHAVAPLAEDRLTAGHVHSVCALLYSCKHPVTGETIITVEPNVGGWGAGRGKDGENGQFSCADGETFIMPVEMFEARSGCRIEKYGFHDQDGGEGEFRGGKGVCIDYRVLADDFQLATVFTRNTAPPWGLAGGRDGSLNYIEVWRHDGSVETYGNVAGLAVAKGELIRLISAHGGGWGNPAKRSRESIKEDLRNRFITEAQARKYYGCS